MKNHICSCVWSMLELTKFISVGPKKFGSLNVVPDVNLLVLRVRPIVGCSHGQEDDVLTGSLLEGQGDRDAAALPGQVGLNTVHHLGGSRHEQS